MSVSFCLPNDVTFSAFMNCSDLCACVAMLVMSVLYILLGSSVNLIRFECVFMGSVVL